MEIIIPMKTEHTENKKLPNSLLTNIHMSSLFNCACTIGAIVFLIFVMLVCKTYFRSLLYWISYQDPYIVNGLFIFLFTLVSFPFLWGYMLLVLSSGYLFGFIHGLITVILSANIGVTIAHYTMKSFHSKVSLGKFLQSDHAQAVFRVISGPQAFKVVIFCRLSPIPFGFQNTIFAMSGIAPRTFHIGTFLGLLPAQCLATYLGSTLRSMEDVLSDHSHATTGLLVLSIQIIFGITLLVYVIHKARQELKYALEELDNSTESSSLSSISIS